MDAPTVTMLVDPSVDTAVPVDGVVVVSLAGPLASAGQIESVPKGKSKGL